MISKEILKTVRLIELRTRKIVNDIFSGEYHSIFKGRGMEFAEVREYQVGDEIRTIDWNVTARYNKPFVKQFEEERQLTVILMVDVSGSTLFGTLGKLKKEVMSEITAVLALSAIKNNDKVGLINFSHKIEKYVPPKKGRSHILRIIREILISRDGGGKTDIRQALEFLNRVVKRKAVVFLLSDFLDSGFEKNLQTMATKHDLILIQIIDPAEIQLPPVGMVKFQDTETATELLLDLNDLQLRSNYQEEMDRHFQQLQSFVTRNKIDFIRINTTESYVEPLFTYFRKRAREIR